jgi:secreted trypsin-like serine protease
MATAAQAALNPPGCGLRPLADRNLDKVVGGTEAKAGDWGWMTGMRRNGAFICGGSLVDSNWVVTAAHCVVGSLNPTSYILDVGMHHRVNRESWTQSRSVSKVLPHLSYTSSNFAHDIAMMKVSTPVSIDNQYIVPVCIPDGSEDWQGQDGWATGWGTLFSGGSVSPVNRQVKMPHLTNARCKERFGARLNETRQMCAGEQGQGLDTCQGDSGGPYVCQTKKDSDNEKPWYLVGITSWGIGCGNGGVYTKAAYYKTWMEDQIRQN